VREGGRRDKVGGKQKERKRERKRERERKKNKNPIDQFPS
jgi:hypothetical protein